MGFPKILDVYEFCNSELKTKLDQGRAEEIKMMDDETKRLLESRAKDIEEDEETKKLMPTKKYEEKKDEKEPLVSDDMINLPFGTNIYILLNK